MHAHCVLPARSDTEHLSEWLTREVLRLWSVGDPLTVINEPPAAYTAQWPGSAEAPLSALGMRVLYGTARGTFVYFNLPSCVLEVFDCVVR